MTGLKTCSIIHLQPGLNKLRIIFTGLTSYATIIFNICKTRLLNTTVTSVKFLYAEMWAPITYPIWTGLDLGIS